ncbi:MAG: insulinase family protein [Candidatus Eremiobacteraeota bacterium]|nr:insulinase family protein [Candidatus Eremiobacteraeota bacterium]
MKIAYPLETEILSNGIRYVIQENHTTPTVSLCIYMVGGNILEKRSNHGISILCQRMLLKSSKYRRWDTILDELEYLGARLSPSTGKDVSGIKLEVLSRYFPEGVRIMAECVLSPGFRSSEFNREKKNLLVEIKKRQDELVARASDLCDKSLFAGHPYRFPLIGDVETVKRLKREDLAKWHQGIYRPDRMVIAVCGDVRPDLVRDVLEEYFGIYSPSGEAMELVSKKLRKRKSPDILKEKRKKRQASLCMGFIGPKLASSDYYAFSVLNQVLSGMGSRLFIVIRDELGLAYMVQSVYSG